MDQVNFLGDRVPPEMRRSLSRRRQWLQRRGRQFAIKQRRQLEPRGLARKAMREGRRRLSDLLSIIEERLIVRLPALLNENSSFEPSIPKRRQDALSDDVSKIFAGIRVEYLKRAPDEALTRSVKEIGGGVSEHNLRELNKTTRQALDVDVFQAEPFLATQIDNHVAENVALIKKVDETAIGEIQEIVFRGARQGLQAKEISAKIRNRVKIAKSRADLIARDQVSKLNGKLSSLRQTNLGVSRYVWRTSQDERVRPKHSARDGQIFDWDSPPDGGHPGEEINCRCYAEPVLEDLV